MPMPPEMASHQLLIARLELRARALRMELCDAARSTAASEAGTSSSSTQLLERPIESIPPGLSPEPRHVLPRFAPQFAAGHADSDPPRLPTASQSRRVLQRADKHRLEAQQVSLPWAAPVEQSMENRGVVEGRGPVGGAR